MEPHALAVLAAVCLVAAFIQGALGIGFALIVAPVIAVFQPALLPVTLLLLMLPLNMQVAWRERAAVDLRGTAWISAGRVAGTFAGMWLLAVLSARQLGVAAGWVTMIAAALALIAPPFAPGRLSSLAVGIVTGVSETSTGIGGPPLALLYQHASGPVLRATVAVCFLVGEVISLILLAIVGRVGADQIKSAVILAPAVILGASVSRVVHNRISAQQLRSGVLLFALISGGYLVLKG